MCHALTLETQPTHTGPLIATYTVWFKPTVCEALANAKHCVSSPGCATVCANLRLRLGTVETAATKGRYACVHMHVGHSCAITPYSRDTLYAPWQR